MDKTGKGQRMQVSYMKGIASHHGPESCIDRQQCDGDALTGESTCLKLSSEITSNRRLNLGEGNIGQEKGGERYSLPALMTDRENIVC